MRTHTSVRRGSILAATLVIVAVSAFTVAAIAFYAYGTHRISERNIALEKANATSEAGLHQLIHYFNHTEDIPAAQAHYAYIIDQFFEDLEDPDFDDYSFMPDRGFVFVGGAMDAAGGSDSLIDFDDSRVTELKATSPRPNAAAGTMFTFWSTAEADATGSGGSVERTAIMDVKFDVVPRLIVPAAVISGAGVSANGQFNLNWGEAWSKGPIRLTLNRKNSPSGRQWAFTGGNNQVNGSDDNWVEYRTADYIQDSGGDNLSDDATVSDVGAECVDGSAADYWDILYQRQDAYPSAEGTLSQQIDDVMAQFTTTGDSQTGYEFWKDLAIRRDTYFQVGADGLTMFNSYGDQLYLGADGKLNTAGSGDALTPDTAMAHYRGLDAAYVAFFDTTDGNPPVSDGSESNWADVRFTGSIADSSQGLLYVAGDLYVGGAGTPPSQSVQDPDGGMHDLNIFHDGVLFTHGDWEYSGNAVVYGAIVCQGGYDSGGTPNIYYNIDLTTGDPQPLSTRARILATLIR